MHLERGLLALRCFLKCKFLCVNVNFRPVKSSAFSTCWKLPREVSGYPPSLSLGTGLPFWNLNSFCFVLLRPVVVFDSISTADCSWNYVPFLFSARVWHSFWRGWCFGSGKHPSGTGQASHTETERCQRTPESTVCFRHKRQQSISRQGQADWKLVWHRGQLYCMIICSFVC